MNIFFAPVSNGKLFSNFEQSVLKGIAKDFVNPTFNNYFIKSEKNVRLWGIRDAKKTTYQKTKIGDFVFFYKEGYIIGYSKIYSLFSDEELSIKIWGLFENKQRHEKYSWSNILVFENFNNCNIPFNIFKDLAHYSEKFSIRGYLEFRKVAVDKIMEEFGSIENFINTNSVE